MFNVFLLIVRFDAESNNLNFTAIKSIIIQFDISFPTCAFLKKNISELYPLVFFTIRPSNTSVTA